MDLIISITGFLIAFILGCIIIPKILFISHKKRLFDIPNERKVHTSPIPRLGGISFFPVILISIGFIISITYYEHLPIQLMAKDEEFYRLLLLLVGLTMLYLVGIADDIVGVNYRYKFIVQIIAAILFLISGLWFNSFAGLFGIYEIPTWVGMIITVIGIVYITNAINLIDGIDGLASGLSCISLFVIGIAFIVNHNFIDSLIAFSTFGIVIIFWFYNVFGNAQRGRKLFMGDTGSLTLGYILSYLAIKYSINTTGEVSGPKMFFAISTLIVPLFDVVRVVLYRLRNKKNPFLPDRNHFHHKLLKIGLRSYMVMCIILLTAIFFILLNRILINTLNITNILIIDILCWITLHLIINYKIKKKAGFNS